MLSLRRGLSALALLLAAVPAAGAQTFTVTATSGQGAAPEAHVRVDWTPTGSAGEIYEIRRARVPDGWGGGTVPDAQLLAVRPEGDVSYADTGALPGVAYQYCVTPAGSGTAAACATGSRDLRRPGALTASDSTRIDGVVLSWTDRSAVELGYVVFRGAPGDPETVEALTAIDTTTADATAALDGTGAVGQQALYCVGLLDGSGGVQTVVLPLSCDVGTRGAVLPPAGVAASDGTLDDRVRVAWVARPGVTYSVYRQAPGQARTLLASGLAASPYEDLNAVPEQPYTYCATASTADGESVRVCDAGQRGGLLPPTDVAAADGTSDSAVEVTWTSPGPNASGFRVYRELASGGAAELVGTVPAVRTRYADATAVPGRDYTYCVASIAEMTVDGAMVVAESARGCDAGMRSPLLGPTAFGVTQPDTGNEAFTELTWESASDVVQLFQVLRDGQSVATLAPFARSYRDATGLSGTLYTYRVRAMAVVDLDPSLVRQGLAPLFSRADAERSALLAEREEATDTDALARLDARAKAAEAALVADIQGLLAGLGVDAALTEGAAAPEVRFASSPDSTGGRRLLAPGALTATTDLEDRVTLAWADRSGIERDYQVRAIYSATDSLTVEVGPNRTGWTDVAVPAGADVTYRVWTLDRDPAVVESASSWTTVVGRRTLLPPGQVRAAQSVREMEMLVTWRDSSRAETGYSVVAFSPATGAQTFSAPANARQFVVPLQPVHFGQPFQIAVFATDVVAALPNLPSVSDPVQITVTPTLLAPRVVTASTGYSSQVVVSWTDDSNANTGYRVTRNGTVLDDALGDVSTFTDSSPTGQATYCVTPTGAAGSAAEPAAVCATGRTSVTIAASTGDVVTTPRFASDLNAVTGSASFGAQVAANGTLAIAGAANDAMVFAQGQSPNWSNPWAHNNAPLGTIVQYSGYGGPVTQPNVGMASFYTRSAAGWTDGARVQIVPSDGFTYGEFGFDVDVEGDVALIGAPGDATFVTHPIAKENASSNWASQVSLTYGDGGAYIYTKNEQGTWVRTALLRGAGYAGNQFTDVTTQQTYTTRVVAPPGSPGFFTYVLNNPVLPGLRSSLIHTLFADGATTGELIERKPATYTPAVERMGALVALTPSWAFSSYVENGAVVVGRYLRSAGFAWQGVLVAPANPGGASAANQMLGRSLDATDEFLAIGSGNVEQTVGGETRLGHVQTHTVTPTGVTTAPEILVPPVGESGNFGSAVAVRGDLLLVGAPSFGPGRAYLYRRTGGAWVLEATLAPQSGDVGFGHAVAIADGFVTVSMSGAINVVYTFRKQGTAWVQSARLTPAEQQASMYFGRGVATTGDDIVIGAPGFRQTNNVETGAVYFATVGVSPSAVAASDGRYANRVQIRWNDEAVSEDGHRIYRRGPADDAHVLVGTVATDVEVFDDFDVSPGDAYSYCVASFLGDDETDINPLGESGRTCDIGYTPPNGTISGRLASSEGGAVIGSPVCLAPGPDQAVMFDGVGGGATIPEFGELPSTFTFQAWVNGDVYAGSERPVMGLFPSLNSYALVRVIADGRPQVTVRLADGSEASVTAPQALVPGRWHHLSATVDNVGRTLALYVDGQPLSPLSLAAEVRSPSGLFEIGKRVDGLRFDGRIDDVRVWSRVLSAAEIAASFADRLPLSGTEQDLAAYWAMDQGTGRILTDLTAGGRHATIEGGAEWTREAAPLSTCAVSNADGNYTFAGLRYGNGTSFRVTPADSTRQFTPAVQTATLNRESPTENQLNFTDTSAYTVRGQVVHAVNQTVWPGQAPLPAPEIEILVDGVVAGRSEADGTFAVAVRGARAHTFEARSESLPGLAFTATLGAQTFPSGTATLTTLGDVEGLRFTNTASRELRGRAAGGCDRPLGDLTFRVYTEDRRFDRLFTAAVSGVGPDAVPVPYALPLPPLAYRLEFSTIGTIPGTLDRAAVIDYFRNLGVLDADLATAADTVDFRFRAPITLRVEGLDDPSPTCAATGYTVVDADGVPRQTIPNVPVLAEYDRPALTIRAYEDYGDGQLCPVDEGTVRIFDGFADAAGTPVEVPLADGVARYTSFARSPDTFAGRTVGGVDRSYQKSLTAVLEVADGPSTTETVWAIVEGYREKPATFVTATMSEIPVMILRDPPGTESSAFVEEETKSCTSISSVNTFNGAGGIQLDLKLGLKSSIGFIVQVDLGGAFALQSTTLIGGGITQTNGPRESNMQVCATTTERWETPSDTGWSREDLYAGVGLNLLFAEADVVTANAAACTVALSTALATDIDASDPFETTFVYGTTHIGGTLIPQLETLARLAGDGTPIEGEIGPAPASVTIRQAIENWNGMLAFNDSLVTDALAGDVQNRSFSAGSSYSFGTAADTTYTTSREQRVTFSTDTRFGGLISAGFDNFVLGVVQLSTEQRFGINTENSSTFGTGYTLSDGDAGDYFSVDTARDPRYGTYVFNTVSGASSNPWEPNTQKRDNPRLAIDPPLRDHVLDGQAATFTLSLTNASESNERREYVLDAPPHLNPRGATIRYQGAVLEERRVLVEPNQTISFPITVERGPEADDYDLAIIAYSPFDHDIWRTAPQLGLVTADTARFQVRFTPLVAPVRLVEPEDGWAVTLDAPTVQLTLGDIDIEGTAQETVGVEFRRPGEAWDTALSVTGDQVAGASHAAVWTPPAAIADGAYELRAFARRAGVGAPPAFAGPAAPGWIDRTAPVIYGPPQPASGVLALGETVALTFEEPVDCVRLRRDLLDGLTPAELVAATGTSPALDIGCAERTVLLAPADATAWSALEGQLATARVRGIRDHAGNIMGRQATADAGWDASWRFTIRRNAFGWTPALVTVRAQPGVPADLPAALVNGRAQPVDYALVAQNGAGLPFTFTETTTGAEVRVTTTPLAGTVVSGDVQPVAFRWPGAPAGTYTSTIEVQSSEAGVDLGRTPLAMTVEVTCQAPLWAVNPAAFETSMTVMAELRMAGQASTDPADLLAAFVGGELRGVAAVQEFSASGVPVGRVPLTVYGPGPAERVDFEAWDNSACARHLTTSQILEYTPGASVGTVAAPLVVEAPGVGGAPLEVPLAEGWTWVSTNREGTTSLATALVGVGSSPNDVIKSREAFSQFVPGDGWFGGVPAMVPGAGYSIFLAQPATMLHPGAPVDPTLPINLLAGWNWTGFLPTAPLPIADALASVTFEGGDVVKSQTDGYAEYVDGSGWFGPLDSLRAGLGYQVYVQSDAVLTYPAPTVKTGPAIAQALDPWRARPVRRMDRLPVYVEPTAFDLAPQPMVTPEGAASPATTASKGAGSAIGGFEHSMILTASLESSIDSLYVAAFVADGDGESLRGLAPVQTVEALGGPRAFLLIASNGADEQVTLRAGHLDDEGTFVPLAGDLEFADGVPGSGGSGPVAAVLPYQRDVIWGRPTAPIALRLVGVTSTQAEALPTVVELAPTRPNPFSATAVFAYALPSASSVRLSLYDVLGREVAVLVDGDQPAGRHEFRFDGRTLASGTYVARLVTDDEVRVRQLTVTR